MRSERDFSGTGTGTGSGSKTREGEKYIADTPACVLMASSLVSSILLLALAAPTLQAGAPTGGDERRGKVTVLEVRGDVELSPIDAMRNAERAARQTLLARFGETWHAERAFWVPRERVDRALQSWIEGRVADGRCLQRQPVQKLETSVGVGYQQSYRIAMNSKPVRRIRSSGVYLVRSLNEHFAVRWGAMGGIWVALVLLGLGIDRATRGWLTGRIAIATLGLGSLSTWLLLP